MDSQSGGNPLGAVSARLEREVSTSSWLCVKQYWKSL
jgi:hypothetical protein